MARKKPDYGSGGPSWLDTYADMVTLLLTFFVLLFAMSSVDATKWQSLVSAFANSGKSEKQLQQIASAASGSHTGNTVSVADISAETSLDESNVTKVKSFDDLYPYLKNYVEAKQLGNSINVYKGNNYTFIIFQNALFFDGDSAEIRSDGKTILDYFSNALIDISNQIGEIRVYGHTAQTESSGTTSARIFDRKLSSERANNVLLYIDLKNIIPSGKMVAEGYGEYRPLVPHDGTEATRKKNRRVELYISKQGSKTAQLDNIYSEINKAKQ